MFAWFPDGKWVVINGLWLLSVESGAMRALTSPRAKFYPDSTPAVSPDGRTVAFSRSASGVSWHVAGPNRRLKAKTRTQAADFIDSPI